MASGFVKVELGRLMELGETLPGLVRKGALLIKDRVGLFLQEHSIRGKSGPFSPNTTELSDQQKKNRESRKKESNYPGQFLVSGRTLTKYTCLHQKSFTKNRHE